MHNYYIIAIPAVYMAVVIPIGYLVNVKDIQGHTHYLYEANNNITTA